MYTLQQKREEGEGEKITLSALKIMWQKVWHATQKVRQMCCITTNASQKVG